MRELGITYHEIDDYLEEEVSKDVKTRIEELIKRTSIKTHAEILISKNIIYILIFYII